MKISVLISLVFINSAIAQTVSQTLPAPPHSKLVAMPRSSAPYTSHLVGKESFTSATTAELQSITTGSTREWVRRYNLATADSQDIATSIALASSGLVWVAGYTKNKVGNWDYLIFRYNSAGGSLGAFRNNGPANSNDFAYAMAVDANENLGLLDRALI